jgi:hypothetical protein
MPKSIRIICQLVARAISHTTWNIPRIRDGDRWRNIENPHLVENPTASTVMTAMKMPFSEPKRIMEERGWNTELTDTKEQCHEHLYYQHYRLKCWKSHKPSNQA